MNFCEIFNGFVIFLKFLTVFLFLETFNGFFEKNLEFLTVFLKFFFLSGFVWFVWIVWTVIVDTILHFSKFFSAQMWFFAHHVVKVGDHRPYPAQGFGTMLCLYVNEKQGRAWLI